MSESFQSSVVLYGYWRITIPALIEHDCISFGRWPWHRTFICVWIEMCSPWCKYQGHRKKNLIMDRVLRPILVGFQHGFRGLSSDGRKCECSLWSQIVWKDLVQSMVIPRQASMGKQCQCWEAVSWLIEGRPSQSLESETNLIRGGWAQLSRPESLRQGQTSFHSWRT